MRDQRGGRAETVLLLRSASCSSGLPGSRSIRRLRPLPPPALWRKVSATPAHRGATLRSPRDYRHRARAGAWRRDLRPGLGGRLTISTEPRLSGASRGHSDSQGCRDSLGAVSLGLALPLSVGMSSVRRRRRHGDVPSTPRLGPWWSRVGPLSGARWSSSTNPT